jgi:cobalt-zinc-cadmium efflux system outer membrane protein
MARQWPVLVCTLLLLCGCHVPDLQSIDRSVVEIATHPFDVAPAPALKPPAAPPPPPETAPAVTPAVRPAMPARGSPPDEVERTSFEQPHPAPPGQAGSPLPKFELTIPQAVPGSETALVKLPAERAASAEAIRRLFPPLPPLPEEPVPLPGPDGRAYTLEDLQRIAAENSPALRQAAADVETAKGLLIQAGLYPNPTVAYLTSPNANNTASTSLGFLYDQVIKTAGKLRIQSASALMGLFNAQLALKRARFDLATTIRGDYYTLLVARETVRVNRALSQFTDEIYRLQADLLGGGFAASHEPAALRSQAFVVRLSYRQAIASYVGAWKELVADMGLKQLPLSAVAGEVDRLIPYYEYDAILAHVLHTHTDVLAARNTLRGAQYDLKLAQVTPIPDVDVTGSLWKEHQIFPLQNYYQIGVSIPFPLWDRNQGNIRAASAALVRAGEGPHAAEVSLTSRLAAAYATYRSNLAAMEYYRRNILPDQVRYYRGVFERRKIDPAAAFGDLVQAQQVLVADVTAYLGVLGSLWTAVVGVADLLQTADLYQLGKPLELPPLPALDGLDIWPCPQLGSPPVQVCPTLTPVPHSGVTTPPVVTTPESPPVARSSS